MRSTTILVFLSVFAPILVTGCGDQSMATAGKLAQQISGQDTRWYGQDQVERGNTLYQANCAACHKPDASGTPDWKKLDANGKLPPPPLNGTAHTWHHPMSVLHRTVRNGGVPLGGTMPPFATKLTPQQIIDILAWVQSHWPDEIYSIWNERNSMAQQRASKN